MKLTKNDLRLLLTEARFHFELTPLKLNGYQYRAIGSHGYSELLLVRDFDTEAKWIKVADHAETILAQLPEDNAVVKQIHKRERARRYRREFDDAMRSLGMTKVRGSVSGKTYWE